MSHLARILDETKGVASEAAIIFMKTHLLGTKLIFVVGKAGTGKTTLLAELTGLPGLKPGNTMETGTKHYQVCPAIIDDEQYLFVDTAGFGDPGSEDIDTFRNISSCLMAFGPFVQVVGVLFIIGRPGTRLDQQDSKLLHWIQCFCGPEFLRNVTIVTSFWDSYSRKEFKNAIGRMDSLYKSDMISQVLNPSDFDGKRSYLGASFYHHGFSGGKLALEEWPCLDCEDNLAERREELRNMIRRRYSQLRFKPARLQFQAEVETKISPINTEAARVLQHHTVDTSVEIVHGRCVVQNKTKSSCPSVLGAPEDVPRSWFSTVLQWFNIARVIAAFFKKAREEQRNQGQEPKTFADSLLGVWSRVRDKWAWSSSPTLR